MNYFYGNLFEKYCELDVQNCIHFIIHGCNAQGRMGSGFAKELRNLFPGAYDEYIKTYTELNNKLILGTNVYHSINKKLVICNSITQEFYGYDNKKYVSYDAIYECFKQLDDNAKTLKSLTDIEQIFFHFPKIGSDLGGGKWEIIEKIIDTTVTNASTNVYQLS